MSLTRRSSGTAAIVAATDPVGLDTGVFRPLLLILAGVTWHLVVRYRARSRSA